MRHRQYASLGKLVRRFKRFQPKLNVAAVGLLLVVSSVAANVATGWTSPTTTTPADDATVKLAANYGKLPLTFEANVGQTDSQVKFLNHAGSTTTYFTPSETVMVSSTDLSTKDEDPKDPSVSLEEPNLVSDVLRMKLVNANANPTITGEDEVESKSNYFIGNDQSNWQSNITNYQKVKYSQVYDGIDLVYYGNNKQMEHDFIVAPYTNPSQIAFHLDGAKELYINDDGDLVAKQDYTDATFKKPHIYQESKDNQIEGSYTIASNNTVSFELGHYDPSREVVIDPTVYFSTYLGGTGSDTAYEVAAHPDGTSVICGITTSTDFPTVSPYQAANGGGARDIMIAKFSADGSSVVFSTYLGGNSFDDCYNLVLDGDGNSYFTGRSASSNYPTSIGAYQTSRVGGSRDAIATKLSADGSTLMYSTYVGANGSTNGSGIAIDNSGNAYLTGTTASSNFATAGTYQDTKPGGDDGYIAKLNSTGTAMIWATYVGGSSTDGINAIIVDGDGNGYFVGQTTSTDLPTSSPYQAANAGSQDVIIGKISSDGTSMSYVSYLGGTGSDDGSRIDIDSSGNAYITGWTASTDFPTSSPYQNSNAGGANDSFIAKINSTGSALTYSTYLGGTGNDRASDIALRTDGSVAISVLSDSTDYPLAGANQATYAGGAYDVVVSVLSSDGSTLDYSSYFGGTGSDVAYDIAAMGDSSIYIAGETDSTNFPTTSPYQASNAGSSDAFLMRILPSVTVTGHVNPTLTFTVDSTTCDLGTVTASTTGSCSHTMTAGSNATNGYTISYIAAPTLTDSASDTITETGATGSTSTQGSEQFGLNLKANTTPTIGAEPSGGSATLAANYNTADTFSFTTSGANVATTSGPSGTTTFTVSYITNIANTTEAGDYAMTQTYNVVANY